MTELERKVFEAMLYDFKHGIQQPSTADLIAEYEKKHGNQDAA